ncbi:MAG: Uma2 family endonuclease [Hormoscilla sp. GM102CHS1]|nr:Uma2 family endonuclease [Hormoscilla sp. GM102CHS1]
MTIAAIKTPSVVYPEPDGEPMAESDPARKYLVYGVEALQQYFRHRPDVYVTGNLWLSYTQGVPSAAVCPDVFVVFGVENRERQSYKVWEENGKTPDWVLEVTSKKTYRKDEQEKPDIYAQMGVSEYFQYDPTGDYLNPPLKGRRLVGSRYQVLAPSRTEDGTTAFSSVVLGLEMRLLPDGRLRFFDPETGEYLRTPQESEQERVREKELAAQERKRADREKELAAQERERADREKERADRLAARLLELGTHGISGLSICETFGKLHNCN